MIIVIQSLHLNMSSEFIRLNIFLLSCKIDELKMKMKMKMIKETIAYSNIYERNEQQSQTVKYPSLLC